MIKNYTKGRLADPKSLKPHPENPNMHPAGQIQALCEAIRENGWRQSVVVSKRSGYVIKGHGRLLAAEALGCKVPVEYQEYPDEAAEIRDLIADNRIAELSMLSKEKCAELRSRFKECAKGWGDAHTGGALLEKQFSAIKERRPEKEKFPILILETPEEYRLFQSLKAKLAAGVSDTKAFAVFMQRLSNEV